MRAVLFIFFAAIAAPAFAPSADAKDGMDAYCVERSQHDKAKWKSCVRKQIAGFRKFEAFIKRQQILRKAAEVDKGAKPGPIYKIFWFCNKRWYIPRHNTHDHVMLARCLEKREKAYLATQQGSRQKDTGRTIKPVQ